MAKTALYRIIDWDRHFESAQSRKVERLTWVRVPNKHDGEGYTELLDHPHGPVHFACWVAIIQVASKCQPRGSLLRDGSRPHDCQALARQTRIPAEDFAEAIPRLLRIGWLSSEVIDTPEDTNGSQPSGSELVADYQSSGARGEEKREEEKKKTTSSSRARKLVFDEDDMEVAQHIWRGVQRVVPEADQPNLEAWANEVRLLRERDNRTHEAIRRLFDWANADSFWAANILSPAKLRKQWTQLSAKQGTSYATRPSGTKHDPQRPVTPI